MSHAYTPGLKVSRQTRLRVRRQLPIAGAVLVSRGEQVTAEQIVASAAIPGDIFPINLANRIGVPPQEICNCLLEQMGAQISIGTELARSKGIFGFFKKTYVSSSAGVLESVSKITGQVIIRGRPIPVDVKAYVPGEIIEVLPEQGVLIEANVSLIQGIFGIGNENYGTIRMVCHSPDEPLTEDKITDDMRGQILVGGARMTHPAIQKGIAVGAAAIISGGIDDQDLKEILGYDLGVAITGTEKLGPTLIITEGFGDIAMATKTFDLLSSRVGAAAAVNGSTQIRAGVMRPEIVIPIPAADITIEDVSTGAYEGILEPGTQVRIIRDPYFGLIGKVIDLPTEPQVLGSGSKARVLGVEVAGQPKLTIPRANVEIIAG